MTRPLIISAAIAALALASPATAGCVVEYKAKRDNPLRLDFGKASLPDSACASKKEAAAQLVPLLKQDGWTLLSIVSVKPDGG
ncbi:MAG: hypothetical protein KDE03_04630 [Rhodobacteraceae bacterium]|nr:hypothetical protein [Paracoccaceae bacterium]